MRARLCLLAAMLSTSSLLAAAERTQSFDADPGWDALNNRSTAQPEREITQRFGFSDTHHAGGAAAGELGGLITPAAEPAYYAKEIPSATFDDKLTASGTLSVPGDRPFHALITFFNADTLNEWRTPNTIAIRINGRGDVFFAYVEYCTSRWRAGGDSPGGFSTIEDPQTGRKQLVGFKTGGAVHRWSIAYDPTGHDGAGSITATIDDETAICNLDVGHKQDGAKFNRFGLMTLMKQWDDPGEVWLDDITVNGQLETFSADPHWDARGNQRTYKSTNVRPRFDFGFSPTNFAGGRNPGELGGLVFRGDIRYPERMAYYGDRLETLTLAKPLRASGTIALRRAVSDSTVLLGFFNSAESARVNPSQTDGFPKCFLGLAIEGPSRDGFFVYPAMRTQAGEHAYGQGSERPRILPDGAVHRWKLDYRPATGDTKGAITVALDGNASQIEMPADDPAAPTQFDRFGLVTTWIDGNGQHVYFDDLSYTFKQDE
jgi:hypothetical protein